MTVPAFSLKAFLLPALLACAAQAHAVVLTGEVRSTDSQTLITPQSNSSPVVIRFFVPEGDPVKKGDVVLRIDPGQSAAQIPELDARIEQTTARGDKEVAELEVKALDAELSLVDAEAELATARIDARIPRGLIADLDYDRYQGELDRATREAALKRQQLAEAREAVRRRREDARLEVQKLVVQREYHALMVRTSEVRADRDGYVVHGFNNNWIGGRIDEGSSTMPGSRAGEVVSGQGTRVRAWALEPDRRGLQVGQAVELSFDAHPGSRVQGTIADISGAPDRRPEWGSGRYFTVDVDFDAGGLRLLPGMSARVIARPAASVATGAGQ
ncbi:HlyD family efflux transporter periplasmic adaptor subunit [Luteimonas aestuarii]|uniref:HlyD family efflux transporter periplasmic adaptor subunit n=1 Tax=Luteimonas aestuarii TaxID=453837 RepID=A0A4V3ALP6_9GAMM|nr:HlyD family efflux transporter periplasmic adaptor subunit [Luteimonas aestuarii]TDK23844.1 HlyD family efflux transporter periplasmic adaptor subunit [Luteimonas aestuarii]